MPDCTIRRMEAGDKDTISRVILAALRETNARDYATADIARIALNFSPATIRDLIERRDVFVAVADGCVVGTASLDGQAVRSVFVTPDAQRQGIGRLLMRAVEEAARLAGIKVLSVPATITAKTFYVSLGYVALRDVFHGT